MAEHSKDVEMTENQKDQGNGSDWQPDHHSAFSKIQTAIRDAFNSSTAVPSAFASDLKTLIESVPRGLDTLDHALKCTLVELLKGDASRGMQDSVFNRALFIIDTSFAIHGNRLQSPCALLETLFSFCTQQELTNRITAIRERFQVIRNALPTSSSHPHIIKAAMSCIRRDHNGSSPEFGGQWRLMLSAVLPIWHVSAMRRRPLPTNNKVNFKDAVRVEDFGTDENGKPVPAVDVALYKAFWGIQMYMLRPSLAESAKEWQKASSQMGRVLSAFETLPSSVEQNSTKHQQFIPKYLTSPAILRLQLVDEQVRRHVLLQYVIFLHHLELTGTGIETGKDQASVKSMQFCETLFVPGGEGEKLRNRVMELLDRDSSGKYKRFIQLLLVREKRWIKWRSIGYKHLSEEGKKGAKNFKRRLAFARVDESSGSPPSKPRMVFGHSDWKSRQEAWKVLSEKEQMDALREEHRNVVPSVQTVLNEVNEDNNDEDVEESLKRKNEPKYLWRSLRVLCADSVEMLTKTIDDKSALGCDLERCVQTDASRKQEAPEAVKPEENITTSIKQEPIDTQQKAKSVTAE